MPKQPIRFADIEVLLVQALNNAVLNYPAVFAGIPTRVGTQREEGFKGIELVTRNDQSSFPEAIIRENDVAITAYIKVPSRRREKANEIGLWLEEVVPILGNSLNGISSTYQIEVQSITTDTEEVEVRYCTFITLTKPIK